MRKMEKGKKPKIERSEEAPRFPFVEVNDLFKDSEWIELTIDVGDATIILAFQEQGFQKFKEAVNKIPHDLNAPNRDDT